MPTEDQPSPEVIRDLDFLLKGVGGEMALGVERRVRKKRRRTYTVAGAAAIALVSWMILPDRVGTPPTTPQDLGLDVEPSQSSGEVDMTIARSPSDDAAEQVTQVRAEEPLEFKLVLPVQELEGALARIDRQIVLALGVDSIRALSRDIEGPSQEFEGLLFGRAADSTGVEEEEQAVNFRPFTSVLASGDIEGAYLVAAEDVEVAQLFLALPEVQRAFPRNVSVHWEADPIGVAQRTYRRLYVTAREAFATGETLEDVPTTQAGDLIAVVRDGEVIATSRSIGGVSR